MLCMIVLVRSCSCLCYCTLLYVDLVLFWCSLRYAGLIWSCFGVLYDMQFIVCLIWFCFGHVQF
ncbi:hypothetical protein HanXRQr2_Chr11g0482431 [Helianthus annuus]|uniref:Uncharacterized protein n=1 Tax=Helianthus annuus TaxID=4232 RepID=A0A9K3HNA4_HELAN|nr:hypothetical protein HanXRQr2_Chr11g0482431 [Helianthus annuus]KAJ0516864.1 hypothetical protein HanHA89_Chr11g0418611 [Helianthus annuus]KAJ0684869.1 hypothetical protein HanLR1_Chr11g0396041 [Helianthus annuus]